MPSTREATAVVALMGGDSMDPTLATLGRQEERNFALIIVDSRPATGLAETDRRLVGSALNGLDVRHL